MKFPKLSYDPGSRPDQGPVTLPSHQPPWLIIGTAAIFLAAKRSFFERVPFFRFDAQSGIGLGGAVSTLPRLRATGSKDRPGWRINGTTIDQGGKTLTDVSLI